MSRCRAFTLVELLVVIGIIGVLISILLPVMNGVRRAGQNVVCQNNLREIGHALVLYANDNRDRFPDGYTLGNSVYRRRPGLRSAVAFANPETLGLPAILHGISPGDDLSAGLPKRARYLPGDSNVWVCPPMPDWMKNFGNTYFWNVSNVMNVSSGFRRMAKYRDTEITQCNVSFEPFGSGNRKGEKEDQPTIKPASAYIYPHAFRTRRERTSVGGRIQGAVNILFLDGSLGTKVYTYAGGGLTTEMIR